MDRRLGRPLPHQLPNPTRADPSAINLSPKGRMRYYLQFPEAIPHRRVRSHALLTRPPLTPKGSLDLHVLGLPPAFVLSQDQTLKLKRPEERILDVRTSAHRHPATRTGQSYRSTCFSLIRDKSRQTVKLTPASSEPKLLAGRYTDSRSIELEPNRPHIPSQNYNVKEQETKTNHRTTHMAQSLASTSELSLPNKPKGPFSAPVQPQPRR